MFDSRTNTEKAGHGGTQLESQLWGGRDWLNPRIYWPNNLTYLVSSSPVTDSISRKKKKKANVDGSWGITSDFHIYTVCMSTCVLLYTYTWMHIYMQKHMQSKKFKHESEFLEQPLWSQTGLKALIRVWSWRGTREGLCTQVQVERNEEAWYFRLLSLLALQVTSTIWIQWFI